MAKRVMPDQAYLRECFDYDPITGSLRWKRRPLEHFIGEWTRWNKRYAGTIAGHNPKAPNGKNHRHVMLNASFFLAHRLIWKLMTDSLPPDEIDHINRNPTDNRWENLRAVTRHQNKFNTRGRRRVHHGLPQGVFPQRGCHTNPYAAAITLSYKRIHLGVFSTAEAAHEAYKEAKKRLHGEEFQFISHD